MMITYNKGSRTRISRFKWDMTTENAALEIINPNKIIADERFGSTFEFFLQTCKQNRKSKKNKDDQPIKCIGNTFVKANYLLKGVYAEIGECGHPLGKFEIENYDVSASKGKIIKGRSGQLIVDNKGILNTMDQKLYPWVSCTGERKSPFSLNLINSISKLKP